MRPVGFSVPPACRFLLNHVTKGNRHLGFLDLSQLPFFAYTYPSKFTIVQADEAIRLATKIFFFPFASCIRDFFVLLVVFFFDFLAFILKQKSSRSSFLSFPPRITLPVLSRNISCVTSQRSHRPGFFLTRVLCLVRSVCTV